MNKKNLLILLVAVLGISLISIGSYALWNSELLTGSNSISSGQVKMSYTETNEIGMNNALPMKDDKGKLLTNYFDFSVLSYIKTRTNDDTQRKLNYNIVIEPISVDNPLGDNEIKVYLTMVNNGVESVVVEPTTINNLNDYILKSQEEIFSNNKGEVITNYRLRAWLDESVDMNKLNAKSYSYKFRVNVNNDAVKSNLDKSGANAPALLSNMIPVYYDDTSSSWKKADESNLLQEYTYKLGDLDNNGLINMDDLNILWNDKCYNKKANTKECIPGDMNNDGYITEEDGNILQSSEYYNKKANIEKTGYVKSDNAWYDYDDKMWANAVTVSNTNRDTYLKASAGTTISMDDINTMWVWIPRYTYTYLNTNTPQEIKIKFEKGTESTGTIKCTDTATGESSTSETCTDSTNGSLKAGTSTYTHPAFTFGDKELTGIWVGKFEVSSDTTCTPIIDAAVGSGCNLQTIRPNIKPNTTSWRGAQVGTLFNGINKMTESGNKYGFSTSDDTHMMKNTEWGAVTYLSHSKYGINKEVALNSQNTYTTGCGPQSEGSTSSGATCNAYQTTLGQSASTTGNITGVYDMSGGAWEYVMGDMVWTNGQMMSGYQSANNYNSAFTGMLYNGSLFTGTYAFPASKYYDKYSYETSNSEYTRGKLGDVTKEMAPTGKTGNWYSDYASFPYSHLSWLDRGGYFDNGTDAGLFAFVGGNGHSYINNSARAVLAGAGALD